MKERIMQLLYLAVVVGCVGGGIYYYLTVHRIEKQIALFNIDYLPARERAIAKVVRQGKRAVPYLVETLESDDHLVRMNVVIALGRIDDPSVIGPLIRLLEDSSPDIQYAAMESIENRGAQAIEVLMRSSESDNSVIASRSIELLGRLGDPVSIDVVKKAVRHPSADVRAQAVIALRWIAQEKSVRVIAPLLDDPDKNVQLMVIYALGELVESALARRALERALASDSEQLREDAVRFLGDSGHPDTEKALCRALDDTSLKVRWKAAEALGKVGGPLALKRLSRTIIDRQEIKFVRNSAKNAIGKIRARRKGTDVP